jgi:hypothetical protein
MEFAPIDESEDKANLFDTKSDRTGLKAGPILDAPDAFFLRRGHEITVADKTCQDDTVKGVEV